MVKSAKSAVFQAPTPKRNIKATPKTQKIVTEIFEVENDLIEKKRAQNRASAARCRIKGIEKLDSLRERRQALLNQIKIEKDE